MHRILGPHLGHDLPQVVLGRAHAPGATALARGEPAAVWRAEPLAQAASV